MENKYAVAFCNCGKGKEVRVSVNKDGETCQNCGYYVKWKSVDSLKFSKNKNVKNLKEAANEHSN